MGPLDWVRAAAEKRILFLPHAITQMTRPVRMISPYEVERVVREGEAVEDYPNDPRGHSCLLLGAPESRAVHVVCAPKGEYLAVLTAYLPNPDRWTPDFRRRVP